MPCPLPNQQPNEWLTAFIEDRSQHDISVAMCLCAPDTFCVASPLSMVVLCRRHRAATRVPWTVTPLPL